MAEKLKVNQAGLFSQEGVALLLVLWVLIMLTVIVGQFCYTMRAETNMTRNFRDSAQAAYLARAGLERTIYAIMTGGDQSGGGQTVWRVNMDIPAQDLAGGSFKVYIGNDSGRININSAEAGLLRLLLDGLEIAKNQRRTIAPSILDWRDRDNFHRSYGAENNYYTSLPDPYRCNNGPFYNVHELLRVRGVDREVFEKAFRGRVTVYPREILEGETPHYREGRYEEVDPDRININAAPPSLLLSLPGITPELVEKINNYRKKKDFEAQSELLKVIGSKPFRKIIDFITFDYSPYYRIEVTGRMKDSRVSRRVKALVYIDRVRDRFRILSFEMS